MGKTILTIGEYDESGALFKRIEKVKDRRCHDGV
jgi:hypothetical protein